jgi:hypothetical protein
MMIFVTLANLEYVFFIIFSCPGVNPKDHGLAVVQGRCDETRRVDKVQLYCQAAVNILCDVVLTCL